jgi:hypothetical protein
MGPAIKIHALLRQAERLLAKGDGGRAKGAKQNTGCIRHWRWS